MFSIQVTGEAVAAAASETVLQAVASISQGLEVVRWSISFNGTSPTAAPVRVELMRFTSAGSSTLYTPKKIDPASDPPLATGRTAFTAEPTSDDVLETYYVTPNGGLLVMQYGYDERPNVAVNGRIGLRVLANDAVNVNAYLVFGE
jgi:hypothetical protein